MSVQRGMQVVMRCCERAQRSGIRAGMNLAHARALLNDSACHVEPYDEARDAQSLRRLAVWAQRYSPLVAPDPPDGLLINISGCQRYFRGERRLARTMASDLRRLGFAARVACASTFACAWAVARHGDQDVSTVAAGDERNAIAHLPLAALRLEAGIINALHEIEIVRIGQLFDLPRSQLATRFTGELLLRLDQARGEAMEVIEPVRLEHPPSVQYIFDGPVLQIEAIELTMCSMLEQLTQQLLQLERGVCRLEVQLVRVDASPIRLAIRLSHPNRNAKHLWSLLRVKVERINLGFGVEQITLTAAHIALIAHEQGTHWNDERQAEKHKHIEAERGELIDTLANRLGAAGVLQAELVESHMPERSVRMHSAMHMLQRCTSTAWTVASDRPTLLLPRPEPIAVVMQEQWPSRIMWHGIECAVVQHDGPERIAAEWWHSAVVNLRDYYKVQDERGHWLWVYCERSGSVERWFIHGVWA